MSGWVGGFTGITFRASRPLFCIRFEFLLLLEIGRGHEEEHMTVLQERNPHMES